MFYVSVDQVIFFEFRSGLILTTSGMFQKALNAQPTKRFGTGKSVEVMGRRTDADWTNAETEAETDAETDAANDSLYLGQQATECIESI